MRRKWSTAMALFDRVFFSLSCKFFTEAVGGVVERRLSFSLVDT